MYGRKEEDEAPAEESSNGSNGVRLFLCKLKMNASVAT